MVGAKKSKIARQGLGCIILRARKAMQWGKSYDIVSSRTVLIVCINSYSSVNENQCVYLLSWDILEEGIEFYEP
jgi:hypothetical protein